MITAKERMDILSAYREVGSYRAAADICGTTHKTVKRVVLADAGAVDDATVVHNYDAVRDLVADRVAKTNGRITAKRLLPVAAADGYRGSDRNFRRLVAEEKKKWRTSNHRGRRPGVWSPGDMLVIDWGQIGPLSVFCAVLAWSRWRFVSFAADQRAETTMAALAACFEAIGGVPATVLTDRMGCLKAGTAAGLVVPTADYVRFATHYGFRPDFCEGGDPESKGLVENLVGYVKSDLMIPAELTVADLAAANTAGAAWRDEVNAREHSEICAIPDERLAVERDLLGSLPSLRARFGRVTQRKVDRLSCVRIGSARYSVPTRHIAKTVEVRITDGTVQVLLLDTVIAEHPVVSPGETSILDEHYGGPRPAPTRAPRPKTAAEKAFCALGPAAEAFIKGAAATGNSTLAADLAELAALEAAHGRAALVAAVERAVTFGRYRAGDVRSILAAGAGIAQPARPGEALVIPLPTVATRPLSDYAIGDNQ
jgi:transposase